MSVPLVVVDADVLGRRRTGDETYVRNLLRELGALAPADLRIAAVTRHPELVPDGIEPLVLRTPVQEVRMLVDPAAAAAPERAPRSCTRSTPSRSARPARLWSRSTTSRSSTERDHMPLKDRVVFRSVVPRAARRARRVLTVSERSRADLIRLYELPPGKVVVTPNGVDPVFAPGNPLSIGTYVLAVGAVQPRKNQRAALAAAAAVPLPLVIAGPIKDDVLAEELRAAGADLRGYVPQEELVGLYQGAACLVQPSRFEGFGLPVLEAMACGVPVVAVDEPALREVAGDAAVFVGEDELVEGVARALEERERLVAAGLERVEAFSWRTTAERTLAAYREALG